MKNRLTTLLIMPFIFSLWISGLCVADDSSPDELKIYSGYYSREGNNEEMARTTGYNHYVRFFPGNRIIRLYVPYPYAETIKPSFINLAFNAAIKQSTGSAYIRSKFGVMDEKVIAHLDSFHWVNNQIMYDCGKSSPCRVTFDDKSMTVLKPGLVLEHKIHYALVKE